MFAVLRVYTDTSSTDVLGPFASMDEATGEGLRLAQLKFYECKDTDPDNDRLSYELVDWDGKSWSVMEIDHSEFDNRTGVWYFRVVEMLSE